MQTDDLAAQMVREMQECEGYPIQLIAIARRYIEKALTAQAEEIERLAEAGIQSRARLLLAYLQRRDQMRRYEQGLKDILNPVGYLRRLAEADGRTLGNLAYEVAHNYGFLQEIAKTALADKKDE